MKSVARVTEISAMSDKGLEDAITTGMDRASKTLKNVMGAWVEGIKVDCDKKGKIKSWRVNLKVTFVLED